MLLLKPAFPSPGLTPEKSFTIHNASIKTKIMKHFSNSLEKFTIHNASIKTTDYAALDNLDK